MRSEGPIYFEKKYYNNTWANFTDFERRQWGKLGYSEEMWEEHLVSHTVSQWILHDRSRRLS